MAKKKKKRQSNFPKPKVRVPSTTRAERVRQEVKDLRRAHRRFVESQPIKDKLSKLESATHAASREHLNRIKDITEKHKGVRHLERKITPPAPAVKPRKKKKKKTTRRSLSPPRD